MSAIKLPCPECGKPTFTIDLKKPGKEFARLIGSKCSGSDCGHLLSEDELDKALLEVAKSAHDGLLDDVIRAGYKPQGISRVVSPSHTDKKKGPVGGAFRGGKRGA